MSNPIVTCIVALLAFTAASASASLIAEDQFFTGGGDYTTGVTIAGQSSAASSGFSGTWTHVNSGIYRPNATGLTYGAGGSAVGELATGGGSLQIDTTPFNDAFREVHHDLSAYATSGTYFFSAVMTAPDDSNGETFLQLFDNGGSHAVAFGIDSNQAVLRLGGVSTVATVSGYTPGESAFFVMRVDVDVSGANDRVSLWANPRQYSSQGVAGTADVVISSSDVWDNATPADTLRPVHRDFGSAGVTSFDEIRFGTTWADVVPLANPKEEHLGFREGSLPTAPYTHLARELRENGSIPATDVNIRVGNLDSNSGVGDMRTVFGFDVSAIGAVNEVTEVTLRLVVDTLGGSGAIGDLELHAVLPGDGGENMVESQVDWSDRNGADPWTTAGGDFDSTVLSSITVGDVTNLSDGDVLVFESSAAWVAIVQDALDNGTPLEFILLAPDAEAGATNSFIRFRSDDFGGAGSLSRPLLSVSFLVPTPAALPAGLLCLASIAARRRRRR